MIELETRETGTPYARQIFIKATESFVTDEIGPGCLWTIAMLRRCLLDAALHLALLKPHDVPEGYRPDLAYLLALFDRATKAEVLEFFGRERGMDGNIIVGIRKMSDDEVVQAFALICMLAVAVGALRPDPKDIH